METLRLVVRDSEQKVTTYVLDDELISVGRGIENEIILDHPSVSRRHARIERKGSQWYVADLESTNGTSIRGVSLIPYQSERWELSQEVKLGDFSLSVQTIQTLDEPTRIELSEMEREHLDRARAKLAVLALNPPKSEVVVGERTTVLIPVLNTKSESQAYEIQIGKVPSEWITLSTWQIDVAPNLSQVIRLEFHPPRDGSVEPGKYPYEVTLRETDGPIVSVKRGELRVMAVEKFSVQMLTPAPIVSGQECVVRVTNMGDTPGIYQLLQPVGSVTFANPYETILLQAGVWNDISLFVQTQNRPIFGQTQRIPFELQVSNQKEVVESVDAELVIRPVVPLWAPIVLLVLVLFVLVLRSVGII